MSPNNIRRVKPSTIRARSRNKRITAIAIIAAIAIAVGVYIFLTQSGSGPSNANPSPTPTSTPTSTLTPSGTTQPTVSPSTSPNSDSVWNGQKVLLETSMGNITLQLRTDKPITTTNFLNIVNAGSYDGTIFHRIIAGFMIQGGGISTGVSSINDEIGNDNHNYNGTIAMAKTSAPNSATSQFFINVADNNKIVYQDGTTFDGTYTVFGKVISGMDVVMAISKVATDSNDAPLQTVTLIKAEILP